MAHPLDPRRPERRQRARVQQGPDSFSGVCMPLAEPRGSGPSRRTGCRLLAYPPEFTNRQVGISTPQEPFEMEFAFSPRGGKEPVVTPVMQIVKIKDGAHLDLLELVDEQPGQGRRIGSRGHRDGAERVSGSPAHIAAVMGGRQRHQHRQACRQCRGVGAQVPLDLRPGRTEFPLPAREFGLRQPGRDLTVVAVAEGIGVLDGHTEAQASGSSQRPACAR